MVNGGDLAMNVQINDQLRIRKIGLDTLSKGLGHLGMVRFLQQFETGSGDYTKERKNWLKSIKVKDIISEIKKQRKTFKNHK